MAAAAGVSVRTIQDAKVVAEKATPEVKAAVKAGTTSVEKAAATTKPAKPAKAKPTETATATPRERDDAPSAATVTTAEAAQAAVPSFQATDDAERIGELLAEQQEAQCGMVRAGRGSLVAATSEESPQCHVSHRTVADHQASMSNLDSEKSPQRTCSSSGLTGKSFQ